MPDAKLSQCGATDESRTSSFGGGRKRSRSDCAGFLALVAFNGPVDGGSADGE